MGREESIDHRADLGLEDDGDASRRKAPQPAARRSSRMPQSRNQLSPAEEGEELIRPAQYPNKYYVSLISFLKEKHRNINSIIWS